MIENEKIKDQFDESIIRLKKKAYNLDSQLSNDFIIRQNLEIIRDQLQLGLKMFLYFLENENK